MITDEDRERVRQATDIVRLVGETVELRERRGDFWGCCPFHHEKSPSFHVNPATGLWKCFGCGEGGDLFAYVMKREGLDFPDAIRYLADRAGIELQEERGAAGHGPKRNRLVECLAEAEAFYTTQLLRGRSEGAGVARGYLAGRGFGSAVCRRWGLGFAPGHGALAAHLLGRGFTRQEMVAADLALEGRSGVRDRFFDRVMFPIHDELGRSIGFGGRVLADAKPKYLNTKETAVFHKGKHLFAFDRAKDSMVATGEAIVCEGYTDVISMHEAGFTNVVAALGTALTLDHVKMIERFAKSRIVCMFDGDAAGQKAAERAVQFVDKTGADLLCVTLPDNQDPAEFLADKGAGALRPIIDAARPLMEFVFDKRMATYDLSVPGRRVQAMDDMAALLAPLKGSILLDGYATQLADMLGADLGEVKRLVREKPVASLRAGGQSQGMRRADALAVPPPPPSSEHVAIHASGGEQPYDHQPFDDGGEATGAPVPSLAMLSSDERMRVVAERELLSMLASHPDAIRPHAERIAGFTWTDARYESMAWAMLATPEGTPPADVVAAASGVVADAPRILASGSLEVTSRRSNADKVSFLLDTGELWSKRREVREIKARLRSASTSTPDATAIGLFQRATGLQRRIGELTNRLSSVVSA